MSFEENCEFGNSELSNFEYLKSLEFALLKKWGSEADNLAYNDL